MENFKKISDFHKEQMEAIAQGIFGNRKTVIRSKPGILEGSLEDYEEEENDNYL